MTRQGDNRTGGGTLLLFIVIFLLFGWILTRGACFSLGLRGPWLFHDGIHDLSMQSIFGMSLGLMTLLHFVMTLWVGIDANRRGMQGILWAALVFFTSIVGLVVYLIVCSGTLNPPREETIPAAASAAPPPPPQSAGMVCAACRSPLEPEFKVCPYCGEEQHRTCAGCGKVLRAGWKVCPYCGKSAEV